ncbi:MAG: hypothetical protein QOE61_4291 [Micromonosporaceae bacterium]|jgi:hypothetical protein|nr:hypothetical protein [Micromonosporaceae bacterium]
MSDIAETVAALEARVAALEDRLAIYQLMATYGPAVDSGSGHIAGALWTEDGVYDAGVGVFVGSDRIAEMVHGEPHSSYIGGGCAHLVGAPHIVVDGDRAVATTYSQLLFRDEAADGYRIWRVTANRWEWVRTAGGWRVSSRTNRPLDGNEEARALLRSTFATSTFDAESNADDGP